MISAEKISVALCTYNGARFLGEQLDSIARQTVLPAELVVCDDGSTDATSSIVAAFAKSAPFAVRFVSNAANIGSTKNYEQAVRLCEGDLIALCDQDDWWRADKLEVLVRVLCSGGAGGVFSDGLLMNENSQLTGGSLWDVNRFAGFARGRIGARDEAVSILLRHNVVTGATLIFRTALREVLLPFPPEWVHDGWLAWMLVLHSHLAAYGEPLIRYRTHASQQIGVPGKSVATRLRRSMETGPRDYRSMEVQFGLLLRYAKAHPDICGPDLLRRIEEKRCHAAFRAELNQNRVRRWREIIAHRPSYRLYAQGLSSMLKDAIR
jgi:hypothetical protein